MLHTMRESSPGRGAASGFVGVILLYVVFAADLTQCSMPVGTGAFGGPTFKRSLRNDDDPEGEAAADKRKVYRLPRDFPTLERAVQHVQEQTTKRGTVSKPLIYLEEGSYLVDRRFKEVAVSQDGWQYYQSHIPIYLDGRQTRALVPDDGSEPEVSPNYPCLFLPTRDVRFINITAPLMMMGTPSLRSRVCGALRLHARGACSLRQLVCLNQEEGVIFAEDGGWAFDGCKLMVSGTGMVPPDIIYVRNRAMVHLLRSTLRPLRRDPPSPEWAAWPPGRPKNGGGVGGRTGVPAECNPSPQGGFAGFGVHASGDTKVVIERCEFLGLLAGVGAFGLTDLSVDDSLIQWCQYGVAAEGSPNLALRGCNFTDNVHGAVQVSRAPWSNP